MTVYLVGAGPGDLGMLTLRAHEVLASAEVVLHDRLVEPAVLEVAPPRALRIDVGKRAGEADRFAQSTINALLVEHGRTGRVVVRLKGGDPYLFGRGGEEALALEEAGIDYEVVPGLSSALAVPAAAGVPLTMRGRSSMVVIATGHDADDPRASVDWERLGASDATLVVVMGNAMRKAIAHRLIEAGRSPQTPVLIVTDGTTPRQRSRRLALSELAAAPIGGPATLVIGAVADCELYSYERRPLHGLRVVVTRAPSDAPRLERALARLGAQPLVLPMIAIAAPADGGSALRSSLARLATFAWVVFASAHGVEAVFSELHDARDLAGVRVAALGSATARALAAHGIVADLVPRHYLTEGLLATFPGPGDAGRRVLLPSADRARPELAAGLVARGWQVERVEAYATRNPSLEPRTLEQITAADAVTFASSSAVEGFLSLLGREALPPLVVTIGPATSQTAREAGLVVAVEASEHTLDGLVAALAAHVAEGRGGTGA